MKILSVQNIACETLGTLGQLLKSDGFEIKTIEAQKDPIPENPTGYSAVVILGGPMAVYDDLDYLQKEQNLIRSAMKNNVPVLGICLGSQLIAQAAGGKVYRGQKKEIGWHDVSLTPEADTDVFKGLPKKIRVFQWHGDTYDLTKNAKVLAYSQLYPQAFRIGTALGIQFHLEVDSKMIQSWMKEYDAEVKAEKIGNEKILPENAEQLEQLSLMCRTVYSNFMQMINR